MRNAALHGPSLRWLRRGWRFLMTAALLCVLMLSRSSYRGSARAAIASHVWLGTVRHLPAFLALSSLVSVVLIRIVLVTAQSYGLSAFALEAVVRMLVLELIPLFAALFVAIRITLPAGSELRRLQARGASDALHARQQIDPLARDVLPRTVAGLVALPTLAMLASLIAMILCYLMLYGPTIGAFSGYTRAVGKIFEPAAATIFGLKTLVFSFAVSLVPMASAALERLPDQSNAGLALRNLVRTSLLIVLVEMLSLVGNYY